MATGIELGLHFVSLVASKWACDVQSWSATKRLKVSRRDDIDFVN